MYVYSYLISPISPWIVIAYLTFYQHGHVHEHVMQFFYGSLQFDDVGVPGLNVSQRLLGSCSVHDDALRKYCGVSLLEHVLQLIVGGGAARDLQLSLNSPLAPFSVVCLRSVVFCHHLDELSRQCGVLGFSDSEISGSFVDVFFCLDVLFDHCEFRSKGRLLTE